MCSILIFHSRSSSSFVGTWLSRRKRQGRLISGWFSVRTDYSRVPPLEDPVMSNCLIFQHFAFPICLKFHLFITKKEGMIDTQLKMLLKLTDAEKWACLTISSVELQPDWVIHHSDAGCAPGASTSICFPLLLIDLFQCTYLTPVTEGSVYTTSASLQFRNKVSSVMNERAFIVNLLINDDG